MRLRQVASSDVDWIFEACQDREIQRWTRVPRPYTLDHASEFVSAPTSEFARWVIQSVASGEPVGVISIHDIELRRASIGYWISPVYRGRGFVVEAIGLVRNEIDRRCATGEITVDVMVATIARDNAASRSVAERSGFEVSRVQFGPAVDHSVEVETCVYELPLHPLL